ncbi:MoxR family ATPase [uncultured Lentibacter sp.]|uniref:AAA family ATPase n=1 Tax=uncultured Lentibacter sp. TaxID=1659309 RepID=UPI00261C79C5|nr:MoxR family ATPase [uncultured Lentibacter sp.]
MYVVQKLPNSIDETLTLLASEGYVADRPMATLTYLSLTLNRPIFLEGEAGVGKTELAKVIAKGLGRELIRLQCYEGLDTASSVYEWNFAAQMLAMRNGAEDADIYSEKYLIKRALLQAVEAHDSGPPVLLIDEIDRTDAPFEAFLLEALSDFQVTVPELGVIKAPQPPIVILTSNRTREVHDALKRRCLYHWVDYPDFDREMEILAARVPEAKDALSRELVAFIHKLRAEDLFKRPGLAETLDWAKCLVALDVVALSPDVITDTIGAVLKYQDDIAKITGGPAARILDQIKQDMQTLQ